ncbi:hypothetical protein [Thiomicrorhabdus chilensis]|uniref:hypothetical protein n=1 Tax=Thiomicrorhabdus chilensis TaxID=63656 RepID=UPI0003FC5D6C|nr:hypothetical protein [Thiomicrorhabdus chilensis]
MADSAVNSTPVPFEGLSLQDIEVPMPPGVDWDFWLALLGWSLIGVLLVVFLLWVGRSYYVPIRLSRQLQSFQNAALKSSADRFVIDKSQLWSLYGWAKQLQSRLHPSEAETAEMTAFMEKLSRLGFSQAEVSRETYNELIQQARILLKSHSVLNLTRPVHLGLLNKDD